MSTVAAIDIGSNSVRLLVIDNQGKALAREMKITRLAQGVDATGELAQDAMARTVAVLEGYGAKLRSLGAVATRVAATSAARDARNCKEFFASVAAATGATPELLSGDEEAHLSFAGATADRAHDSVPTVVFDIGGGSTEFAMGRQTVTHSRSLNIGCVRITERFLLNDPPTAEQLQSAASYIVNLLKEVDNALPCRHATQWLGLAGTVTSLAALDAGLTQYNPEVTHGYRLTRQAVSRWHKALASRNLEQRRDVLMEPKRAGVVVGGTIVLHTLMEYFGLESIVVSERDILDGLAASALATLRQG